MQPWSQKTCHEASSRKDPQGEWGVMLCPGMADLARQKPSLAHHICTIISHNLGTIMSHNLGSSLSALRSPASKRKQDFWASKFAVGTSFGGRECRRPALFKPSRRPADPQAEKGQNGKPRARQDIFNKHKVPASGYKSRALRDVARHGSHPERCIMGYVVQEARHTGD